MIFLTATFWLVSWSRAELFGGGGEAPRISMGSIRPAAEKAILTIGRRRGGEGGGENSPDEAKGSHAHGLEVRVPRRIVKSASNCVSSTPPA
jgi:hypothetical protein